MGLSGRKEKQRIGNDPRNLTWADDAAKFGSSYLSKFGWDSSKGLGAEGEGRVSHIKVSQKLDMLGIGAAQQRDPNGIAWKQNKDFERLLERLNADTEPEVKTEATDGDEEEKKRKREDGDEAVVKKKRRKSEPVTEAEVVVAVEAAKPLVPRHRAHRARAIAAKNIASKSAAAIAEILGVAPTPSTTATATPEGTLTPYDDDIPLEKLSTSTKSVADYFKDKLLAKAGKSTSATPTPSEAIKTEIVYDDAPRGGLGTSRVKLEPKDESVDPPARMGLGSSKLSMTSFFAASTLVTEEPVAKVEEEDVKVDTKRKSSEDDTGRRKDKKGKRRQVEDSESTPLVEGGGSTDKKTKKRRGDKEEETEPVDEDERKKAKKERKRLKALKEQGVEEEDAEPKAEPVDEDERKKAKKERKRLKALQKAEEQ
ncbi:hypothetical protein DFH08DRAFT_958092 [Mycena albidolilacea]|uniref:G-patch domain-containing protein n=1 Tax=Mycena albidolilacea TaxID=1033008 RepID=A0AAD7A679_9AGAR|nr:hypothetical protein DFH08DRAFT_958092 [Mycena albidolilacea]